MTEVKPNKNLSPFNVLSLSLGSIIGWGAFILPGDTFLPKAGPIGTLLGFVLSMLLLVVLVYNYAFMANRFPKAGGEFLYAKEVLGGRHAFFCSWFLSLAYLSIIPLNASALALLGRTIFGNVLMFGFNYSVAGYDIYLGEILLSVSVLIIFAILCYKGVKISGLFQNTLTVLLVFGVMLLFLAVLFLGNITIDTFKPGFSLSNNYVSGILYIVALTPWAFMGFQTIPQSAEEFNFSPKKIKRIMLTSILLGGLTYVLLTFISIAVIPSGYNNWYGYIKNHLTLQGLESLPLFYVSNKLLGTVGLVVISTTILAAILTGIMGFFIASSRLLYSMSLGKILLRHFSMLDDKYKTPKYSILFILIISIISSLWGRTALNWIVEMSSLGGIIGFLYTTIPAFIISKNEHRKFLQIISTLGILISLVFLFIILFSVSKESYWGLLIWSFLGLYQYLRLKKGISM